MHSIRFNGVNPFNDFFDWSVLAPPPKELAFFKKITAVLEQSLSLTLNRSKPLDVKPTLSFHSNITPTPLLRKKILIPQKKSELPLDIDFIYPEMVNENDIAFILNQASQLKDFDTSSFLIGRADKISIKNDFLLTTSIIEIKKAVKEIEKRENLTLEQAYKRIITLQDGYDYLNPKRSSFAFRSAILISSQEDCVPIDSWMVYTKIGKPLKENIWLFLNDWKNFIPEAQGAMAKMSELILVKANKLTDKEGQGRIVLLKGASGSGKSWYAKIKFNPEDLRGLISPDVGKEVIRRSIPSIPHASAHVQGAQLAYTLFNNFIRHLKGPLIYDSTLSLKEDIKKIFNEVKGYSKQIVNPKAKIQKGKPFFIENQSYLDDYENLKSLRAVSCFRSLKEEKKTLVIYDIVRSNGARALAILSRSISGKDPRVPPDVFIKISIRDQLNRYDCMRLILDNDTRESEVSAEYYLILADEFGTNSQEVLILKDGIITLGEGITEDIAKERLSLQGINYEKDNEQIHLSLKADLNEINLTDELNALFNKTVNELLSSLSEDEKKIRIDLFSKRVFNLKNDIITNPLEFYQALDEEITCLISSKRLESAFSSLDYDLQLNFFSSCKGKKQISYLDYPLRVAFIIHQHLPKDPWL